MSNQSESNQSYPFDQLGATGKHPEGSAFEGDEGELSYAVGRDDDNSAVVVLFGKQVGHLEFPPDHGDQLAASLDKHAEKLTESSPGLEVTVRVGAIRNGNIAIGLEEPRDRLQLNKDQAVDMAASLRKAGKVLREKGSEQQ